MPGQISIYLAGIFALLSTVFYSMSRVGYGSTDSSSPHFYRDKWLTLGRFAYYGMFLSILFASMYLLSNILQHNFQFAYIWEYSSRELYNNFLVATFYAGQEGSFLLWTLFLSIIGFLLIPYVFKRRMENTSMIVFSLILLFLAVILIFKSPFEYVWEKFPDQNLPVGFTPENGRGLNPILQNYWITIHPPILFMGYSLLAVPYALAVGGFLRGDYRGWIRASMPWTLFASGTLGIGLMLGGFWAYETLGWGGFWAWDPVENSSLIPWLVAIGLLHTTLVSLKTGGLLRSNFVLATLAFIFVLYATFLTRSGVLGDTSVHSFVSPGPIVYQLLLIMLSLFFVIALVLIGVKFRKTPDIKLKYTVFSKEAGLIGGTIVLLLLAFLVSLGTSWPVIAEIIGEAKQTVDPSAYNSLGLPLGVIILFMSGLSVMLNWTHTETPIKKLLLIPGIAALIAGIISAALGADSFWHVLIWAGLAFSIVGNLWYIKRFIPKGLGISAAGIAHIGVGILILGAMLSGAYMETEQLSLRNNEVKEVFGKEVVFTKREQIELHWNDRDKYKYYVSVEGDTINPIFYWSDFNQRQSPFMEPGIQRTISHDLYFSPKALMPSYGEDKVTLRKGDKTTFTNDTTFSIQLLNFDMSQAMADPKATTLTMGTGVRISSLAKGFVIEDTLYSEIDIERNQTSPYWYTVPGFDLEVGFMQLIPDKDDLSNTEAVFAFKRPSEGFPEILVFDVSRKPFINLVWAGTIVMVLGIFLSLAKYTKGTLPSSNGRALEKKKGPEASIEKAVEESV